MEVTELKSKVATIQDVHETNLKMIQSLLSEIQDLREKLDVTAVDTKDATMATVIGELLLDQCANPTNARLSPEATILYMTGWLEQKCKSKCLRSCKFNPFVYRSLLCQPWNLF